MTDTCPVCGKGEWEDYAEIGPPYGHRVSHLDCVLAERLDHERALSAVLGELNATTQRAEQAEAKVAKLKARRCETCDWLRVTPEFGGLEMCHVEAAISGCDRWQPQEEQP